MNKEINRYRIQFNKDNCAVLRQRGKMNENLAKKNGLGSQFMTS